VPALPEGVFTNLFVETEDVAAIIEDPRVAAVTLTGSERAGVSVAATAGRVLKKSVLELGGSDPFIVLASADLEAAVRTGVPSRLLSNGQSCIAAKRFIVVEPIADEFIDRFTAAMDALVVGDPLDPATEVGPIVTEAQRDGWWRQVEAARAKGRWCTRPADEALDGPGWYLAPTVLTGVTPTCPSGQRGALRPGGHRRAWCPTSTPRCQLANSTTFGLGSSVWSSDEEEIQRCIEEVKPVRCSSTPWWSPRQNCPFGGIKRSGYGRELSELGLKEFCNAKTVWIA
jgi:succinate-semialdehyde dehydrogenase/glutarate-semialdehyde dehydrogenase